MSLTVSATYRATWDDQPKVKWEIAPKFIVPVTRFGAKKADFVKLPRQDINSGLTRLVFHCCPNLPSPLPKGYSLSASIGYKELVDKRNLKQKDEFEDAVKQTIPEMFRGVKLSKDIMNKRSQRRTIMEEKDKLKKHPAPISIEIPAHGDCAKKTIEVLRSVHPREDLAVPIGDLCVVIRYIQWAGFSSDLMSPKQPSAAVKGVFKRRRKDGTPYFVTRVAGRKKYKTFNTFDEAVIAVGGQGETEGDTPIQGEDGEADSLESLG